MKNVTFQVIEGVDKGRMFRDLPVPVSIGREEGNGLRLNDERVSRFHAKIQYDGEDVILTDLDSTNGTRINGDPVQIRRLQAGDRVGIGRSVLVFGSADDIKARLQRMRMVPSSLALSQTLTIPEAAVISDPASVLLDAHEGPLADKFWATVQCPPVLPKKMNPSQAARVTEILDFLHRGLASAAEGLRSSGNGDPVSLPLSDWLKVQAVQTLLAHYARAVSEPDEDD